MEENIFAHPSTPTTTGNNIVNDEALNLECEIQMRPRPSAFSASHAASSVGGGGVLSKVADRVVAEQEKWKFSVEEQRRHVLSHQMLN